METFFKKYFWTAQLAFVVIAGFLLAGAVNAFAASALARFSVPELVMTDAPPPIPGVDDDGPDGIFPGAFGTDDEEEEPVDRCADVECEEDEECNPVTGACEAVEAEEVEADGEGPCYESDIALNLVGTMVTTGQDWAVAVLHNPSVGQTQFARVGTNLLGEGPVTRIERNRLFITRNGREECLRPGTPQERAQRNAAARAPAPARTPEPDTTRPVSAAARTPSRAPTGAAATGQTLEQRIQTGIQRGDDGSYQVPRDLIQEVANNSSVMEQHAPRVVPNYENGQPRGFRLQGIRSGSIFSAIGVRNGDVIVSVNGTDIDSPQRALELYQAMLQQDEVNVTVLRRGREHGIRYQIQ